MGVVIGNGEQYLVTSASFLSKTANIATLDIMTAPTPGNYFILSYTVVNAVLGTTVKASFNWIDLQQSQGAGLNVGLSTGSFVMQRVPVTIASGDVHFQVTGYTSGTYSTYVWVTR